MKVHTYLILWSYKIRLAFDIEAFIFLLLLVYNAKKKIIKTYMFLCYIYIYSNKSQSTDDYHNIRAGKVYESGVFYGLK